MLTVRCWSPSWAVRRWRVTSTPARAVHARCSSAVRSFAAHLAAGPDGDVGKPITERLVGAVASALSVGG